MLKGLRERGSKHQSYLQCIACYLSFSPSIDRTSFLCSPVPTCPMRTPLSVPIAAALNVVQRHHSCFWPATCSSTTVIAPVLRKCVCVSWDMGCTSGSRVLKYIFLEERCGCRILK
jgi:hypothetical protein